LHGGQGGDREALGAHRGARDQHFDRAGILGCPARNRRATTAQRCRARSGDAERSGNLSSAIRLFVLDSCRRGELAEIIGIAP
jgi:hypothetical protein